MLAMFKVFNSQWLLLLDGMNNKKAISTESSIGQCLSLSEALPKLDLLEQLLI